MATIATSIANLFRPTQQVSMQPPAGPMAMQNPGAQAPLNAPAQPAEAATPANPLDEFASLWQNDPKLQPQVDPLTQPLFNSDPVKIQEAANKMDFISQLQPDLLAKAMSGQLLQLNSTQQPSNKLLRVTMRVSRKFYQTR